MTPLGRIVCRMSICMVLTVLLSIVAGVATAQAQWNEDPYEMAAVGSQEDNVQFHGTDPIDPNADRLCFWLPEGATLNQYAGSATVVGQAPAASAAGAVSGAVSGAASAVAQAAAGAGTATSTADECPTEWIELETPTASVYKFSPSGADEGEVWEQQPARIFIMCDAEERIFVCACKPGIGPELP